MSNYDFLFNERRIQDVFINKIFIVGMTRWAVYYLGSPDKARNFSYKLRFTVPEDDHGEELPSMVFRSPCTAAPEDDGIKFIEHKYFFIHRRALESYCLNGNDLNYGVSVYSNNSEI